MTDYLPPVVAKLTGDDASLKRVLASSKQDVKRWAVEVGKTEVTLKVGAKLKDGALAEVRRRVAESPAAKLRVNLDLAAGQREALQARLADREIQAKVTPKVDQTALRRVQTILMELGRPIRVSVRPEVDDRTQRRVEARLTRLSRDRTATIRTRVIGGGNPRSGGGSAGGDVKMLATLISLGPALAPIAASLASVAVQASAAGLAVGVFGIAAKTQISGISGAADAQAKYNAAVAKYGAFSKQAQTAQEASARSLDGMPAATQRATEGWLGLTDAFRKWSNSLAGATMEPVTKSFAVAEQILPRLTPMVKGTSDQLNRLVTLAGGAVASPGFDAFMKRVSDFANGVLKHATDDVVHFSRVLSEGSAGNGPVAQFMAYAKQQGPAVRQTLADLARAVETILKASAQAGPGMLTLVDDVAKLVAALPPEFVARVMQAYAAFRLFKLANSGIAAVADAVRTLAGRMTALRAASTAAGSGIAGVRAAIGSLSTATKIGGAIAVIAGVALVLDKLSSSGKKAPDVDRMTTALGRLSQTGKASGELTRVFGADLDGLGKAIDRVSGKASGMDKFNDVMNRVFTLGMGQSNSMKQAKKDIDAIDKGLASLVASGHADQAAQALKDLSKAGLKIPKKNLDDYNSALADAAYQAKLTAQSMGLFGAQAQQVQKKLDAQKRAVQGLQQAILDLDDTNQAAYDTESAYQQSIADTTSVIKHHEHALRMNNGVLDLSTQKARDAYAPLSQLAQATKDHAKAVLTQTGSQDKANRVLITGHDELVRLSGKLGLNTQDAKKFADSLDSIKDPNIQVTVATMKAETNLAAAKKKVKEFPKSARTDANFQYQQALRDVRYYQRQVDALDGKTATTTINIVTTHTSKGTVAHEGGGYAYGGVVRRPLHFAAGGSVPGYAPLRDTVPAVLSPGEGVLVPEAVRRLGGDSAINAINRQARGSGALSAAALGAVGGNVPAGLAAGMTAGQRGIVAAAQDMARAAVAAFSDELGIASPSKKFRTLGAYVTTGLVQGLTGSTASVRAATKRIASMLYTDFGSHHKGLQKAVRKDDAELLKLATERDSIASKLKSAQSKLSGLQKAWSDERSQVAQQIMQGASVVTTSPQPGFALTAADVVNNLKDQAGKASAFAAQLRALQKKGLRSDLIAQIAAAGVDQGGATAAALAGASKGTIGQLNSIQKGLASSANATGAAVADSMYAAGINSAKGLVNGLKSQEKAIEKQMLKIARSMEAAIKKALGIHSPSRVMAELGDHTARGLALGIERSTKHVAIAASGMAMAARQSATITGMAGGGHVRGGDIHVHVTVHGSVTTERKLVDTVENALATRARLNPGGFRPVATWANR